MFGIENLLHQRLGTVVSAALSMNDLVQGAGDQQPDIIIAGQQIDPSLDPQVLVAELQRVAPQSRLVLVGHLRDGLLIHDLLAMGVRGYLCVGDALCVTLLTAIETVLKERLYRSPTPNAEYQIDRVHTTLSGGELQRVQLAQVLAQIWEGEAPRYLLLDKPINNIGLSHQHGTLTIARQFAERGVGALTVLHALNLAAQYADRVLVLKDGQALAEGTPLSVLTQDIIRQPFDLPVMM